MWFLFYFTNLNLIKIIVIVIFLSFGFDFLKYLPIILPLILSIAFLTLLERKILASMQRRRGPNVVGPFGFLQAFADGVKLILKETIIPTSSNYIIFIFSPILIFSLSLYG
jgi:NADH-quinone oxidoreductase subunit H